MNKKELKNILRSHAQWLENDSGIRANLKEANLHGANLAGAVGNMREVRSVQLSRWPVVICAERMWVGCVCKTLREWKSLTPPELARIDQTASEWRKRWGRALKAILAAIAEEKEKP